MVLTYNHVRGEEDAIFVVQVEFGLVTEVLKLKLPCRGCENRRLDVRYGERSDHMCIAQKLLAREPLASCDCWDRLTSDERQEPNWVRRVRRNDVGHVALTLIQRCDYHAMVKSIHHRQSAGDSYQR